MKLAYLLLVVLFVGVSCCDAAVIYGKVYRWDTLDAVKAVVTIRDGSFQRMVAENGTYSFNVSPGNYTIEARWKDLIAIENITVGEGINRFDIILFPELDFTELPEMPPVDESSEQPYPVVALAVSGAIISLLYYLKRRESRLIKRSDEERYELPETLPEDLMEVVEIIRREGGRITQKELRKKLGYSEAKMSLIIADLERRGIVEKVKKGRGNIIFLKT